VLLSAGRVARPLQIAAVKEDLSTQSRHGAESPSRKERFALQDFRITKFREDSATDGHGWTQMEWSF
jgi:hypothetical protein